MTTTYVTRDALVSRLTLAEQDEPSDLLGGTVRLREITRQAFKDAARWAASPDLASREQARGARFAALVRGALDLPDSLQMADRLRGALSTYYVGAPESATDADRWNAALLAASWIDPATGVSVWKPDEILAWPARPGLWDEIARLAQVVIDLASAGQEQLKSGDIAPAAE